MIAALARVTLLQSLAHRPFALLWTGQTISRVGDHLYEVALAWWVLQETGSATAMSLVLVCALSPMLLFLLLGGVAGDRWPRVRLMFLSDLGRGLLVAGVAVLAAGHHLAIWHVYVASLLFGFVDAFFQPAYSAAVLDLTPAPVLPSANALTSISQQMGRIAGPALGAALVAVGGTPLAFALNAGSFFLAAGFLIPLLGRAAPGAAAARPPGVLRDLREALHTVRTIPVLWIGIGLFALTNITLAGPYSVALPFLVHDFRHADVGTLGFLYTMFPIGYLLGGIGLGRLPRIRRRGWWIGGGVALAGAMLGLFALPLPLVVLALAAVINGVALQTGGLAWTSTLQEQVPAAQFGRVSSMELLGSFGLLPVGLALTGLATAQWGPAPVFFAGGLATLLLGALALLPAALRRLD